MCKKEIMGLTLEELQTELAGLGMKKFRAEQVFRWLYEKAATDFSQMSNLSKDARQQLADRYTIATAQVKVLKEYRSRDGLTHKVLLELTDGATVETVLMHHDYGYSVCLSSQVGCAMNCAFCQSGPQPGGGTGQPDRGHGQRGTHAEPGQRPQGPGYPPQ